MFRLSDFADEVGEDELDKLIKTGVSVKEMLQADEVVYHVRTGHENLVTYLAESKNAKDLVGFVTQKAPEEVKSKILDEVRA